MLKKRIFIFLKILIYFIVDNLVDILFFLLNKKVKMRDEILVIGHHQLGDFILSLDTLKEYKMSFPDFRIVLLCNETLYDLAMRTKYFDEIILINVRKLFFGSNILTLNVSLANLKYRVKKLLYLKTRKFIKILNPANSFHVSLLVKRLNADEKIGVLDYNRYLGNIFNWPYTKLVSLDLKHELNDLSRFFRTVSGREDFLSGPPVFEFYIPRYKLLEGNSNYCVVSLGGSFFEKTWDVANFANVLGHLNFNIDIVLVGLEGEKEFANKFCKLYSGKNLVINLVGKTSLIEYISVIKYSKFVFGNDSGVIHAAVACKIPSLCITSGHGFQYCVPYVVEKSISPEEQKILPISIYHKMDCFGCGLICRRKLSLNKKFECVENIRIDDIIIALNKIFDR